METLPNEILFEIFRDLFPLDLLHLARTHRRFRCVLMDRQSANVWTLARANVNDIVSGLPDPIPKMSEPEFADLMFGFTCFNCGKEEDLTKCSPLGKERLCKACWPSKYKSMGPHLHSRYDEVAVARIEVSDNKYFVHKKMDSKYSQKLKSMEHSEALAWRQAKEEKDRPLFMFQDKCFRWLKRWESHLLKTGEQLVIQRIAALGWQEERNTYLENEKAPEVMDTVRELCRRPLTGKVWDRLDKILLTELEAHKVARLERERLERELAGVKHLRELRKEIILPLPRSLGYITAADLLNVPAVYQAFNEFADKPGGTLECFDFIRQEFLNYHNEWVTQQEKRLITLVRNSFYTPLPRHKTDHERALVRELLDPTDGLDPEDPEQRRRFFSLASTVFQCGFCRFDIRYPTILGHECMTSGVHVDGSKLDPNWRHWARLWECPWGSRCEPRFSVVHYARIRRTISVFGYDPDTATYDQVSVGKRIALCLSCVECFNEGPTYMHVQTAIFHVNCRAGTHTRRDPSLVFEIVPESVAVHAREKMREKTIKDLLSPHIRQVACVPCGHRGGIRDMKLHVFEKHGQLPSKENLELWASSTQSDFTPSRAYGARTPMGFHFRELDAETLLG